MSLRLLILTGSPQNGALQWDTDSLVDGFIDPVKRFAGLNSEIRADEDASCLTSPNASHAAWRVLGLAPENHLATGYSQGVPVAEYEPFSPSNRRTGGGYDDGATSFLSISDLSSISVAPDQADDHATGGTEESVEEVLSQFYEHSLAIYEETHSSQIPASSTLEQTSTIEESFSPVKPRTSIPPPPTNISITDLAQIPSASHLHSISPQTMTVCLLVSVITITPPRPIITRRGETVHLLELLVGDEKKSGFCINFWLPYYSAPNTRSKGRRSGKESETLQATLDQIRPQDIVLLQNVALSSFRGKVHGQSMRRARTKVWLLFRNRVDRKDTAGYFDAEDLRSNDHSDPLVEKTAKVREWMLRFLGGGRDRGIQEKGKGRAIEDLPPDTQ